MEAIRPSNLPSFAALGTPIIAVRTPRIPVVMRGGSGAKADGAPPHAGA